jgi:hypothetical protein
MKMSLLESLSNICNVVDTLDLQKMGPVNATRIAITSALPHATYQYSPLTSLGNEIRLISLLPGNGSKEIKCSMVHTALDRRITYEALSYAWGKGQSSIRLITLDSVTFPITPNLWDALYHLRSEKVSRVFWIDALCINQIDDVEKGKQIRIMRDIYANASRVVIWLGKSSPKSDLAMDILSDLQNLDLDRFQITPVEPIYSRRQDALQHLFARSWWFRSWVLQQVAVARSELVVVCGNKWVAWNNLQAYSDRVIARRINTLLFWPTCRALLTVQKGTEIRVRRDSIGALLVKTYHFEATDGRDKINSLLGLATAADCALVEPSYQISVRQLYSEMARHILNDNDISVNILCFAVNSPNHDLPSWVPDWSQSNYERRMWMPHGGYHASIHARSKLFIRVACGLLGIYGYIVDNVMHYDANSFSHDDVRLKTSEIVNNIEELVAHRFSMRQSVENSSLSYNNCEALWRTLLADRARNGPKTGLSNGAVSPEYGRQYEVFRERAQPPNTFMPEYLPSVRKERFVEPFLTSLKVQDSQFFITSKGCFGLGPLGLQAGDLVIILDGADMPFVVRERGPYCQLMGCAYVHGLMQGEAFQGLSDVKRKRFFFK